MRELRTQESENFERFFKIVREAAEKEGCIFFVDCGEGRDIITDKLEGEDLSGWLIPKILADEFEIEWLKDDVSVKWNKHWRFAIWNDLNDTINVEFKEF